MSERPPVVVMGVEVSASDALQLQRDGWLFGNAYIEVTRVEGKRKFGRRIEPTRVVVQRTEKPKEQP